MCHWKRTTNEWEIILLVSTSNKSLDEVFEGPAWPDGLLYDATVEADDAISARLKFRQLLIDYLDATVKNYNRIMSELREKLVKDEGSVYGKSLLHWSELVDPHRCGILDEEGFNTMAGNNDKG
jgi:hypothetical protein